jgi:BirA family biotin operon repressor/biotin-[acetyl-CoA-carboxylase] ligase
MAAVMQLRKHLLKQLSDGKFHSGEALGEALGVTRMAVWKHLKALREMGISFEVVRGKGYRLPAPVELLDEQRILSAVTAGTRTQLGPVEVLLEVDSTNNRLHEQALKGAPSGTVCIAEQQTAGRGRQGRTWVSPFAENLYLSLLWHSRSGAAALGGLSLVAGIAVLNSLQEFGIHQAGLKWPNDILVNGAKLAGILIDVTGESSGPCAVIIGIGLNVCMSHPASGGIDQSWVDLHSLTGGVDISRNRLAAGVLDKLLPAIELFESRGMQPFMDEWRQHDIVDGCQIELQLPNEVIKGKGCGIDSAGALLVETSTGRRHFACGEVSIRVAS